MPDRPSRPIALALAVASVLASACSAAPATPSATPMPPSATPTLAVATPSPTPSPAASPTASPTASPGPAPAASVTATATTPASASPAVSAQSPTFTAPPDGKGTPVAAFDAAGLTKQLVLAESSIRDPSIAGGLLEWYGHLEQLVVSTLADFTDWQAQALAALPEKQRAAVAGSLEASRQLRTMRGPVPRSLPNWQIRAPRSIETLMGYYREAEAKYGVPWYYLAAVHLVESRMGRIHGLSTAGAQGPMQFMPATWAAYGTGDVNDDHDAIMGAANYLRANGAPGDMDRALYAYNHSLGYVGAVKAYAQVLSADPDAYRGYWGWQVYYTTQEGTFLLPAGWTPGS